MLISITEKCRMGCSHCMDDARADSNKFMDRKIFEKAIRFNLKYDKTITITGGEPTEHPQFWEFLDYIAHHSGQKKGDYIVSITTNGMNLSDNNIAKIVELNKYGDFLFQVSTIEPYYPIKINTNQKVFHLPYVVIATSLAKLEPRGRAREHKDWTFTSKAPQCFNLRSIVRTTKDFQKSIYLLRGRLKFCTPQIAYDGSIKVGESTLCPPVAHIDDNESTIVSKIIEFKCNGCKDIVSQLPKLYRSAIGEN